MEIYCTECGKPIKEAHKFCGSCGAPVREREVDVIPPLSLAGKYIVDEYNVGRCSGLLIGIAALLYMVTVEILSDTAINVYVEAPHSSYDNTFMQYVINEFFAFIGICIVSVVGFIACRNRETVTKFVITVVSSYFICGMISQLILSGVTSMFEYRYEDISLCLETLDTRSEIINVVYYIASGILMPSIACFFWSRLRNGKRNIIEIKGLKNGKGIKKDRTASMLALTVCIMFFLMVAISSAYIYSRFYSSYVVVSNEQGYYYNYFLEYLYYFLQSVLELLVVVFLGIISCKGTKRLLRFVLTALATYNIIIGLAFVPIFMFFKFLAEIADGYTIFIAMIVATAIVFMIICIVIVSNILWRVFNKKVEIEADVAKNKADANTVNQPVLN